MMQDQVKQLRYFITATHSFSHPSTHQALLCLASKIRCYGHRPDSFSRETCTYEAWILFLNIPCLFFCFCFCFFTYKGWDSLFSILVPFAFKMPLLKNFDWFLYLEGYFIVYLPSFLFPFPISLKVTLIL